MDPVRVRLRYKQCVRIETAYFQPSDQGDEVDFRHVAN